MKAELGTSSGGESRGGTTCGRVLEGEPSDMMAPAHRKNLVEEEGASTRVWVGLIASRSGASSLLRGGQHNTSTQPRALPLALGFFFF